LWARPTTPDSAEQSSKQKYGEQNSDHENGKQNGVGRQKCKPEDREPTRRNVQQDKRLAAYLNERQQCKYRDQHVSKNSAPFEEPVLAQPRL
jgi:hypothetical protein